MRNVQNCDINMHTIKKYSLKFFAFNGLLCKILHGFNYTDVMNFEICNEY
jgi:hypothetical protein